MIDVYVEGRPAPKGSRISVTGKDGRTWTRPASKYEEGWEKAVKAATQVAMRHALTASKRYCATDEMPGASAQISQVAQMQELPVAA
jgi:hypothetical protein